MRHTSKIMAVMVALSVSSAVAADWPWIYGPKRDNTSDQKGVLRTWPKEGPKVLWTAPVGVGFGGPAVSGGNVYLLDRDEKIGDTLRVFDLATGKEIWTLRLRRARQLHVCRLADDSDGRWRARLHLRPDGRSARHQHEDTASPSGARTSGRTSAAASCPGGPSFRIR